MPGGQLVDWLDGSKTELQRKCKFTLCFESTCHYGFVTEKIMDAFYADTIPVYYGSPTVTDIFNRDAFINCGDYPSFDAAIERIRNWIRMTNSICKCFASRFWSIPHIPGNWKRTWKIYMPHF